MYTPLKKLLLVFLLCMSSITAWAQEPFRLAIAPHSSTREIIKQYLPVSQALEKSLGHPVRIVTALNFTQFIQRALAGEYDLVVTTAHQATLLVDQRSYIPLVTYKAPFEAVAVTNLQNHGMDLKAINGHDVIGLNPASLVTLWGEKWLRDNNIHPSKIDYITASDSAARALQQGDAVVAFMSLANFQTLPKALQDQLAIRDGSGQIPGRVYALSPRWADHADTIRQALFGFADTEAGQSYFREYRMQGYRELKPNELDQIKPFADQLKRQLGADE